jgi:cyanate permease
MLGLGFCSTGRSIFLAPITQALGISRSAFSVSDSIRFLVAGLVSFFFAKLVDRFGTKRLIGFGLLMLIAGVLLYATARNLIFFYMAGVCFGLGFSLCTTMMVGIVNALWFEGDIGLLMGIVLGSNGFGGAISTQLYTPLLNRNRLAIGRLF